MGPYFEGQHPAPCGHYYPDVTRVKDDPVKGKRFWYCSICHRQVEEKLVFGPYADNQISNENWRQGERERLMSIVKPKTLPEKQ